MVRSDTRLNSTMAPESTLEECPICLAKMVTGQDPRILKCGHVFCLHCLQDYQQSKPDDFKKSFPCPLCRTSIKSTKLNKLPPKNMKSEEERTTRHIPFPFYDHSATLSRRNTNGRLDEDDIGLQLRKERQQNGTNFGTHLIMALINS